MTNYLLDFETSPLGAIALEPEDVARAVELSQGIKNSDRQWQTYLDALALFGFESWIEERNTNLTVNSANCSIRDASFANLASGVFNLTVGEFKVCLLTGGVGIDEFISLSRVGLDLAKYAAHFYVVVDVIEERNEVAIARFMRYDELVAYSRQNNLTADSDWTYEIPLSCFNEEIDDLLLNLRCLSPAAIPLPQVTTAENTNAVRSQLESLIPQLQSSQPIQSVLSWEQAAAIFNNNDLLNWLDEVKSGNASVDAVARLREGVSNIVEDVTQRAINARSWLSNELDELAQSLAWNLLPAPAFATVEFRDLTVSDRTNPIEEFGEILAQLRNSGEDISPNARGAYRDFTIGDRGLRLFMVAWAIAETENVPEWSLLVVLGAQPDNLLPQGLSLEIKEGETLLDEKIVEEDTDDSYVYTRVIGELNERFTVSVKLADGTTMTFPEFAFIEDNG